MVGDTLHDLQMARAAGITSIAITWGNHDRERLAPLADVLVDDVAQLGSAPGLGAPRGCTLCEEPT